MNDMVDMSNFVEAKSDQLNSDDLIGGPRTVTVRKVTGSDGDQPIAIYYDGDNGKPFKPCKTIRRILLAIWGRYANDYVGKSMTLYRDDSVAFGGLAVGGIRISHMTGIDKETVVVVMKTKGKKAGIKIEPLVLETKPDKAAEWASEHIAAVQQADDAAYEALVTSGAKAMGKLKNSRPELHASVEAAYAAREAQADDVFGGKSDSDTGESHTAADELTRIQADLEHAQSPDAVQALRDECDGLDLSDEDRADMAGRFERAGRVMERNEGAGA